MDTYLFDVVDHWYKTWNISFDVFPLEYDEITQQKILVITHNDTHILSVKFTPNKLLRLGYNDESGTKSLTGPKLKINSWSNVQITCSYYQSHYFLKIFVNDEEVESKTIPTPETYDNVNVFTSIQSESIPAKARLRYVSVNSSEPPPGADLGLTPAGLPGENNGAIPPNVNPIIEQVLNGKYPPDSSCNSSSPGLVVDTDSGILNIVIFLTEVTTTRCSESMKCEHCFDNEELVVRLRAVEGHTWLGRIYDSSKKGLFYCHQCNCENDESCVIAATTTISVGYEDSNASITCSSNCYLRYFEESCNGFYDQHGFCIQRYGITRSSWATARETCEQEQAVLPRILDEEYNYLVRYPG